MAIAQTLLGWTVNGRVVGTIGVTADHAVAILGDSAFIKSHDWEIVEKAWEHRGLFGYVYGGACSTAVFESDDGMAMRRLWPHRQALARVRQLRMHWAEGLRLGWGLVVCGLGDSPWVRRVAGEMVAILATDERYDAWARAGRPLAGLDLARRRAAGAEATAEVENRYRGVVFDRGVTRYLLSVGVAPTVMGKERKAFTRALGLMWSWAVGLRVPLGWHGVPPALARPGGREGALVIAVPQLGSARSGVEASTVEVEVIGSARARRLDAGLGGGGRAEQLAKWLAGQLANFTEGKVEGGVSEALGYRLVEGRLVGALVADWSSRLAQVVFTSKMLGEEGPTVAMVIEALKSVGRPMFEASGLLETAEVTWLSEGFGCEITLVERARKAGVERLALAAVAKGGYWGGPNDTPRSALVLASVGRPPRGRTVYRDFLRARLGTEDRRFWDKVEKDGGCIVTEALSGGQRLVSLFDGLASAYLTFLGLGEDLEGPLSSLMEGRDDADLVTVEQMATLKEAVTAASVWAMEQILREGHRWLGLSAAHRRALASAFHRFEDLLVKYPTTGVWQVDGKPVAGLEPMVDGKPLKVNTYLAALRGDDRFFGAVRHEQWHERAGGPEFPMTPPATLGALPWVLFRPLTPRQYLKEGSFFLGAGGQWERREGTGGAVFPGLTTEPDARAVGHIVTLLGSGVIRHRRAMLTTHAAQQGGGKLPLRFVPWVPLGMGDVGGYASAMSMTNGVPLGSKFLVVPTAAEVKLWTWGRLRAHWAYVGRYPSLWRVHDLFDLVPTMLRVRECLPKGLNPISKEPLAKVATSKQIWAGLG